MRSLSRMQAFLRQRSWKRLNVKTTSEMYVEENKYRVFMDRLGECRQEWENAPK